MLLKSHYIVIFLLFLVNLAEAQSNSGKGYYLYVAAESQDEVGVVCFDGAAATVIERIPVGVIPVEIEGPHGLAVSPDGDFWYLSMAHGKPYGHVYKYTTGDNRLVGRVELGFFPATMEVSRSTGFLFVVNFNLHGDHVASSVSVVDTESMTEVERITTGIMPHGSRLSPDGMKHYSVAMMSGELFEIDALTMSVSRTLYLGAEGKVGQGGGHVTMHHGDMKHSGMNHDGDNHQSKIKMPKPTWVFPHPTRPVVYIANNGVDEVIEVSLQEWAVKRRFSTSAGPYNVEVSRNGRIMAVTYKSDASTGIWDLEKGKELAKIKNSRRVSHGVVISPDNRYAFISVEGVGGEPGSVDVIDIEALKLAATADVGKQAGGIAFWKIDK